MIDPTLSDSFMGTKKRGAEACFDGHGDHDGEHKKRGGRWCRFMNMIMWRL